MGRAELEDGQGKTKHRQAVNENKRPRCGACSFDLDGFATRIYFAGGVPLRDQAQARELRSGGFHFSPMTETQKEKAFYLASLIGVFCPGRQHDKEFETNKSQFLEACAIYWENRVDLKCVAFAAAGHVDYLALDRDAFAELMVALQNQSIPQYARDSINQQIAELRSKKAVPKTTRPRRPVRVYLMRNTRNGLVKIGHSSNPIVREGTLQSQEPEVELLGHWPGTIDDEHELHEAYSTARVRGEWFKLTDNDVSEIKERFA